MRKELQDPKYTNRFGTGTAGVGTFCPELEPELLDILIGAEAGADIVTGMLLCVGFGLVSSSGSKSLYSGTLCDSPNTFIWRRSGRTFSRRRGRTAGALFFSFFFS